MSNEKQIGSKIIEELEKKRKSKIIVYFTGDRTPVFSRIAEDAVRPLYENLTNLEFPSKKKIIDLFLYSRGGNVSVPWRITTMIREFCDEFNVLIPYKAQSAATLLSLGSDSIVMGKKAELGPIDPSLERGTVGDRAMPLQEISVEDVNSFILFVKEKANINDQMALAQVIKSLIDQISPLTLGSVNRQNYHIRLVARKLLTYRKEKIDEEKINTVIDTLTEKMYSHGHGIGRREAREIGLPVVFPDDELEEIIWKLYLAYEEYLNLNDPVFPEIELKDEEKKTIEDLVLAVIESSNKLHVFKGNMDLKKNRKIPPSPQINFNLNLQLPPGLQPEQIPQAGQRIMQNLMNQISQTLPQLIQQEITRQSPIIGYQGRFFAGKWIEEK